MEPVFLSKLSDSRAHTLKLTTLWAKIPTSKGCSWEWKKSSERVSQFSSVAQSCPTLCDPMNRSTPGLPVNHQLPESTQTHAHWVSDAIHISSSVVPFSSCPQSLPASGSFSSESTLRIRWPKYWSFSFSISPSSEHPGLISFRMDWWDLLTVRVSHNN